MSVPALGRTHVRGARARARADRDHVGAGTRVVEGDAGRPCPGIVDARRAGGTRT